MRPSPPPRRAGIRSLRLLLGAGILIIAAFALRALFVGAPPESVASANAPPPAPAAVAPAPAAEPDRLEAEPEDAAPEDARAPRVVDFGAIAERMRTEGWRVLTGTVQTADTGAHVQCRLTCLDAAGAQLHVAWTPNVAERFLANIPKDTVRVVALPARLDREPVSVDVPSGDAPRVDIRLPFASGSICGQVIDERGVGVAGIRVNVSPDEGMGSLSRTTDKDGRFDARPLRSGRYRVRATDGLTPIVEDWYAGKSARVPDPTAVDVSIAAGEASQPVILHVARGATIAGRVLDAGTEDGGIARAAVVLSGGPKSRIALTDGSGAFRFAQLAAGDYELKVNASDQGFGPRSEHVASLRADEERSVEVRLPRGGGAVFGRLLDDAGETLPFVPIIATRSGEVQKSRTDSRGRFEFGALAIGSWTIAPAGTYLESRNWTVAQPVTAAVAEGARAEVEIRLRKGLLISGRVKSASNQGDLRVRLGPANGDPIDKPAGEGGRFAFGALSPGNYKLAVFDPKLGPGTPLAVMELYVDATREGIELETP